MCGIAGIISPNPNSVLLSSLQKMAAVLQHRGPNAEGFFINENATVGFAHRRLSIIDLSDGASQPMHYHHCSIVFNGEIYNYLEIKNFLKTKGFSFSTQSDTEVIIAAYLFWGKNCLQHFDGMFAFAIYNDKQKELFVARDYFGEKPLYYYVSEKKDFYFASEMKALWAIGIEKKINHQLLLNYLTLGYTSCPINQTATFYSNIKTLEPGSHISIKNGKLQVVNWKQEASNRKQVMANNEQEIIATFSNLLSNSVSKRLRSDVAIGTSLSGGLDSSSIVAHIHQLSAKNNYQPQTFTASFPSFTNDETIYSKAVASHFNLQQHIISPTEFDFVNEFQKLMYHQEEPLQSSSVFVQYMVYKLAKEKGITVLLDGQGADEILGGYKKYSHWFLQEMIRYNLSKFSYEKALLATNDFLDQWNYKNYIAAFFPKITAKQLRLKAQKQQLTNQFIHKDFLQQNKNAHSLQKPVIKGLQDILTYNTHIFGLHDLLRYADRNSMAHSREVRLPFLNKELEAFVSSLPSTFKINNGFTKWILRESIKNKLPQEIVWRKGKIGYEPPQQEWMKHKQVQEMIISARKKLVSQNILNSSILDTTIQSKSAHEANNFDWWILCAAQIL